MASYRTKFEDLQKSKLAKARTQTSKRKILAIPHTLVVLEDAIARVTEKIGSPEFRELTGPGGKESFHTHFASASTIIYDIGHL